MPSLANAGSDAALLTIRDDITLAAVLVSIVASSTNLFLLFDMKIRNAHTTLITLLSAYQLVYDATLYYSITNVYLSTPGETTDAIFNGFSSVTAGFISNLMLLNVLYIIVFNRIYPNLNFALKCGHAIATIPGIVTVFTEAFASVASGDRRTTLIEVATLYFIYIRLASVLINVVLFAYMAVLIRSRRSTNISSEKPSRFEEAIKILVRRLWYYPLVQIISRVGAAYYELTYGFDFTPSDIGLSRFIALIVLSILLPLASVGYLAIFLVLQPRAWSHLKSRILTGRRPKEEPKPASGFGTRGSQIESSDGRNRVTDSAFVPDSIQQSDVRITNGLFSVNSAAPPANARGSGMLYSLVSLDTLDDNELYDVLEEETFLRRSQNGGVQMDELRVGSPPAASLNPIAPPALEC